MLEMIQQRVEDLGAAPAWLTEDDALHEILSVKDLYGQEAKHMASFSFEHIKIFKRNLAPQDARALSPPVSAAFLRHYTT